MSILKKTLVATLFAATAFGASQTAAHGPETATVLLPVISAGGSFKATIKCSHGHYVMAGGVQNIDQLTSRGPLVVTASYPMDTHSWTVEFTNDSGRPTGKQEATVTLFALCGYRH